MFSQCRFQTFQVIAVDDATLAGVPLTKDIKARELHMPNSVVADAGGTRGKLETPLRQADQWPARGVHLDVPSVN